MANVTDTYYAAQGAFHGYGTQLMAGDGASPENFEALVEVVDFAFGTMETAVFERTHLRSPDAHKEKLLGLRDSGAFVAKCNWRPKHESQSNAGGGSGSFTAGGTLAFWRNRTTKNYKLVAADGSPATEIQFTGGITKYQIGAINLQGGTDLTIEITPLDGSWQGTLP
jgi:hypothetical protein